jgi:hypothetical protein
LCGTLSKAFKKSSRIISICLLFAALLVSKQLVLLEGVKSSTATVDSGVPQGTVLGPLLFLVYINDLPENFHSSAKLFADDCLLYREVNTTSDTNKLQEDLVLSK